MAVCCVLFFLVRSVFEHVGLFLWQLFLCKRGNIYIDIIYYIIIIISIYNYYLLLLLFYYYILYYIIFTNTQAVYYIYIIIQCTLVNPNLFFIRKSRLSEQLVLCALQTHA
jgi:hypothetical protein